MATMNVSLPGPMKNWVENQVQGGKYANASEYVRDLIRRDQAAQDKHDRVTLADNGHRPYGRAPFPPRYGAGQRRTE